MTIEEKIEYAKKFIPEIEGYDIEVVKKLYELAEKKHPEEAEEMLKIYLLGYLLTSSDGLKFEEIQISNVVLKEGEGENNAYLNMYKKLLDLIGKNQDVTVSII